MEAYAMSIACKSASIGGKLASIASAFLSIAGKREGAGNDILSMDVYI
jgi:hypothetical protein